MVATRNLEEPTFLRQRGGSLYLFYDELQVEPGLTLPKQLAEVKCRLALYVSCRSSHEIAAFGLNALGRKRADGLRPRSSETASGHAPRVVFLSNGARPSEVRDAIGREINRLKTVGIAEDEITVLSCRAKDGQNGTRLLPFAKLRGGMRYWDGTHARFETVRTFKGKESDAVIVAEADETVWDVSRDGTDALDGVLLYLGATRARMELTVVVQMDDAACGRAMKKLDAKVSGPRGRIAFAKYLGADIA
ncbi:MAG: ATP-binding domain-containing protein [Atopobiaceae bacterium]|nr:ATP-binding domain-containing protein [Atopobiaceae bacterium]